MWVRVFGVCDLGFSMFLRQGNSFRFGKWGPQVSVYISKTISKDLTIHRAFVPFGLVPAGQGLEMNFTC